MDTLLLIKSAVMGVVEGLTEFIPVSSTGHLIITERLIGFALAPEQQHFRELFDIVVQFAAILAVCVYYRHRLWALLRGCVSGAAVERRFALQLAVAFVPIGIVGLLTHKLLQTYLFNPGTVAATLAVGGLAILLIERRCVAPRHTDAWALPWRTAIAIGCCQCLALIPGTSRSGATIMGALLLGLSRPAATEFSFFLAIPTMFVASAYSIYKFMRDHGSLDAATAPALGVGMICAFVSAWLVVAWLIRFVSGHTFTVFGWYRLAAGLLLAALCVAGIVPVR